MEKKNQPMIVWFLCPCIAVGTVLQNRNTRFMF